MAKLPFNPRRGMIATGFVIALVAGGMLAGGPRDPYSKEDAARAAAVVPTDAKGLAVYREAKRATGTRIVVSTGARWLWLIQGRDTVMSVPVAVGMAKNFEFKGKKFRFETPRGKRRVLGKVDKPLWTVPEWHYYERATDRNLEVVFLKERDNHLLSDGTYIEVRDKQVGRVNTYGNFWPFEPGVEIIFDDKIFVPPLGTPQRNVPDALGPHKLVLGDGYLIHGTHDENKDSVGMAVSHGCVRMHNEDLVQLNAIVNVGTPVFIY
jgi:hypothetical protein